MGWAQRKHDIIALMLLVGVTVLVFAPVLVGGAVALPLPVVTYGAPWSFSYDRAPIIGNTLISDLVTRYYPHRLFYAHEIAAGRLPLWNPYLLSGTPYMAMGNTSVFYPLSLLFVLLPTAYAFGFVAWLHWTLAGVFAWLLARYHGVSAYVALMAAVVVMGNSTYAKWLGIPDIGGVATWAPLVLLGASMLADTMAADMVQARIRASALFVGALLMSWYAQPEVSAYTTLASVVVVLGTVWLRQPSRLVRASLWLGGALAVFVGLFAPQLLPSLELSRTVSRQSGSFYDSIDVFTTVAPEFFVDLHTAGDWGARSGSLASHYIGVAPLLIFALGLWRGRDTTTRIWGGIAVLLWLFSISSSGSPWWQLLPIFSQFHDINRAMLVASVGIAVVIAREIESVRQHRPAAGDGWSRVWLGVWVSVLLFHVVQARIEHPDVFWQWLRSYSQVGWALLVGSSVLVVLFVVVRHAVGRRIVSIGLIVVASGDVLWYWYPLQSMVYPATVHRPTSDLQAALTGAPEFGDVVYPATQTVTFLRQQPGLFRIYPADYPYLQTNMTMGMGLYDIRGFESLFWGRYGDFIRQWEGSPNNGEMTIYNYATKARNTPHWFHFTNVKYMLFRPNSPEIVQYRDIKLVYQSDEGSIYENTQVLPRAYLVDTVESFTSTTALYDRLRDPTFAYARTVVTSDAIPPVAAYGGPLPTPDILEYTASRVRVRVDVTAPVLLVLSDTNYPGWQVWVDDVPQPVYTVNGVFRGVYVAAGTHEVRFVYWPQSLVVGLWWCGITLGLLSVMWWLWRRGTWPLGVTG